MPAPDKPLWFSGLCDGLLAKISLWRQNYHRGEITRTRKFLDPRDGLIDKPVRYGHIIPMTQREADHLVYVMQTLRPSSSLTEDLTKLSAGLTKCQRLINQQYAAIMDFWETDVAEIEKVLIEAREGKKTGMADYIREQLKKNAGNPWGNS